MIPKYIVTLLSGGLDSVVLAHHLVNEGHKVHACIVRYGQQHVQEVEFARYHASRLNILYTVLDLPQLSGSTLTDGKGTVVVPNRNAILISHAVNLAVAAGADTVTYGCNADDEAMFPDCRRAFVQAYNIMLMNSEIHVEVCAPFMDKHKWWIAGLGREMGVELNQTWSCYRGGKEPCGECEACLKRNAALDISSCKKGVPVA